MIEQKDSFESVIPQKQAKGNVQVLRVRYQAVKPLLWADREADCFSRGDSIIAFFFLTWKWEKKICNQRKFMTVEFFIRIR